MKKTSSGVIKMKKRLSFVSNSSSSSFVCEVCGRSESGWDASLEEFGMVECENYHVFCEEEMINAEDYEDYKESNEYESGYEIPEKFCPICNFHVYSESDMKSYLKSKYEVSEDDAFAEVKKLNKRRKKLYDSEYNFYVCKVKETSIDKEFELIKSTFKTYKEFRGSLK